MGNRWAGGWAGSWMRGAGGVDRLVRRPAQQASAGGPAGRRLPANRRMRRRIAATMQATDMEVEQSSGLLILMAAAPRMSTCVSRWSRPGNLASFLP